MGRPPIGKTAMTGAERTRLYRLKRGKPEPKRKLDAGLAALERERARVRELEAELARERTRTKMPKPAKPPLPPDEKREQIIRGLRTQVSKLTELNHMIVSRIGAVSMSVKTQNAIAKVLHPDSRKHASEANKDDAYKAFNAWKADKDKAERQGRR